MKSIIIKQFAKTIFLILIFTCIVFNQTNKSNVKENKKSDIKITYIANEGVLIKTKTKQVLIDGLHRIYGDNFAFPPDDLRKKIELAKKPYDGIDLLLVSHLHGDHFHPKSVGEHLKNNPKSILATSEQINSGIKKDFAEYIKIKPQIQQITHEWKKSVIKDFNGIKVKFLGLRHVNEKLKWIQNLGHLVEMDGKKFLHVGDADMAAENFAGYQLNKENIDVAFVPYWFLLSKKGRDLVEKQFVPKHIVAVHVSPKNGAEVSETLKKYYSDITVFTKILETKEF